ncbi:tetratricopeptide repeat protein [Candidatus Omnitrophota bacterium]
MKNKKGSTSTESSRNSGKRHAPFLIALSLVCLILFANTLSNSFIWDDKELIFENSHIKRVSNIPFLFSTRYWNKFHPGTKGQYRPVRTLTFAIDHRIWKLNPFGYHLTNLFLHIANVLLVYFIVTGLCGDRPAAGWLGMPFLCALLFAAHPMHVESVAWIKNRSDILASVFFMASFLLFSHCDPRQALRFARGGGSNLIPFYAGSILCFTLSLLSKEMAISLPFALALYIICFLPKEGRRSAFIKVVPFFVIMALYLAFKMIFLGMLVSSANAPGKAGLFGSPVTVIKTVGYYCMLLALPFRLNTDRAFPIPDAFFEGPVLASAALLLLLLFAGITAFRRSRLAFFALIFILLTIAPASNIIFLSGRPIAEQRLYIPSFGFCLLLAMGINRLGSLKAGIFYKRPLRYILLSVPIVILAAYSAVVINRNPDWRDSTVFWSKAAELSPESSRSLANLGKSYYDAGRHKEALVSLTKAVRIDPFNPYAHNTLGLIYSEQWKNAKAIASYNKAVDSDPSYVNAYNNMGITYNRIGKRKEAAESLKKALKIDPYYAEAHNNLGVVYAAMGRPGEALRSFEKAIEIDPYYADAYDNLGKQYSNMGKTDEAIASYHKAMELKPENALIRNGLGILYAGSDDNKTAIAMFKSAIGIDPGYAEAYNNLAVVYYSQGRYGDAVEYCDRAAGLGYRVNGDFLELLKPYRNNR